MKAIIILDQIQAGLGGKERADTPLGGKKLAMGSAENVAHALSAVDGEIMGDLLLRDRVLPTKPRLGARQVRPHERENGPRHRDLRPDL